MKAHKVSLIQTLPGKEFDVVRSLNDTCQHAGINNYYFLKALGGFDLIVIHEDVNFRDDSILEYTPFNYITNQNEIFCFCKNGNNSLLSLSDNYFAGIIRFNFELKAGISKKSEVKFDELIAKTIQKNDSVLGSLTDLLIIIPRNSFDDIMSTLKDIQDASKEYENLYNFKTYSYLTINYSYLFQNSFDKENYRKIISNREEFCKSFDRKLCDPIDTQVFPNLSISTRHEFREGIKQYFLNHPYRVSKTFGSYDLVVRPKLFIDITRFDKDNFNYDQVVDEIEKRDRLVSRLTWADFIFDLLHFRYFYGQSLHSTNTNITYDWETGKDNITVGDLPEGEINSYEEDSSYFSIDEIEKIFEERAKSVARHLISFDRMKRDAIFKTAYSDMLLYPYYILVQASNKTDLIEEALSITTEDNDFSPETIRYQRALFSRIACDALSIGCELRSNGIQANIEQRNARFLKIKGGVRKALLAIEYIPTKIFMQATIEPWYGFVNVWEQSHVFQIEQVINIPQRILWDPKSWWVLWHECAHIFIDCDGVRNEANGGISLLSKDSPAIRAFLSDKELHSTWLLLLNEVAAEIIGFEFGFCENFDLFFQSFWKYIKQVRDTGSHLQAIEPYVLRTFLVEVWSKYKDRSTDSTFFKIMQNMDEMHKSMLSHIKRVEIVLEVCVSNKDLFIADSIHIVRGLHAFISHIEESICAYEAFKSDKSLVIRSKKEWLSIENTTDVIKSITSGDVWHDEIKYPQAVVIGMLNYFDTHPDISPEKEFSINLAMILSFYGQQRIFINEKIAPNPAGFVGFGKDDSVIG